MVDEEKMWNMWRESLRDALRRGDKDMCVELCLMPMKCMPKMDYKELAKNLVVVEPLSEEQIAQYKAESKIETPSYDAKTGKVMCGDMEVMPKTKGGVIVVGDNRDDFDIVSCDVKE